MRGGLLPVGVLSQLTSVGTLFAFVLVSVGVMILRLKRPDIPRGFRVPGGTYLVPLCGAATSTVPDAPGDASARSIRLFGWMAIGLVIYALYGRKHSKLAVESETLRRSPNLPATKSARRSPASSSAIHAPSSANPVSGGGGGRGCGAMLRPW